MEHDCRLRFVEADPPEHAASDALLRQMRDVVRGGSLPFTVHFGRIPSGDEDVVESARAVDICDATGALCAAWEGNGGARVADFDRLDFLEVRGVTDVADADSPVSFRENLAHAMRGAALLLSSWRVERGEP